MSANVIVTGCAGFIGSNLCHWLLKNSPFTVIGIDDMSGGFEENIPDHIRFVFVRLNVADHYLDNVFQIYRPDVCFHLAAYASEGRSNHIRKFIHQNNTIGTCNVINACVKYDCKLVFTSSVAVYSGTPPFNEQTIPNPIDEYGLSKYMSERSIQIASEVNGLEYCIVRPRNVYGIRQSIFDPSRNLLGIWCYQALNKEPLTVFGKGESKRCFTYIDDILQPLANASTVNNKIINLGSPHAYKVSEALEAFKFVTGYTNVKYLEPREEVPEAICDINTSQEFLEYKNKTNLTEGILKMWEWAKTIKMRPKQVPPPLEITQNAHISLL